MAASYRRNFAGNLPENRRSNELDQLCVFGYSCKLFRDDERSQQMNDPSCLIPWMGDNSLLIDRYDGRGHLYSLREYDVQYCKPQPLTEEEQAIEKACDEERYLELHVDVREREMYEEEEVKRLYESLNDDSTYTAVQFTYDEPQPDPSSPVKPVYTEDTEPFICPPELSSLLPTSLILPPTAKLNAIIVKTALFVSQHGGQFEIMIKTKQKDNIQFRFMDIDHALNRYYKVMIDLIKSKKYIPPAEPPPQPEEPEVVEEEEEEESSSDDEGGHYLHPSLLSQNRPTPPPAPSQQSNNPQSQHNQSRHEQKDNQNDDSDQQEETLYYQYPQYPSVPAPSIIPPPPNLKPIIDKMAEYVAKNGQAFEQNVRQKGDSRFEFLKDGHMFNPYYLSMKEKFDKQVKEDTARREKHSDDVQKGKVGVSFSIKSKEPEPSLTPRSASARLAEDSDSDSSDDTESRGGSRAGSRGGSESRDIVSRGGDLRESRGGSRAGSNGGSESRELVTRAVELRESRGGSIPRASSESRDSRSGSRTSTPTRALESRVDDVISSRTLENEDSIPDVLEHRLEANGTQRDHANDKSVLSHKDKLAERKRKAAAFVNLLKRAKTDGSLNLDLPSSPARWSSSRSAAYSPLPELPDI